MKLLGNIMENFLDVNLALAQWINVLFYLWVKVRRLRYTSLAHLTPIGYILKELAKIRSLVLSMWSASTIDYYG
jgi:hypothetical protein